MNDSVNRTGKHIVFYYFTNHNKLKKKLIFPDTDENWDMCLEKKSEWETKDPANVAQVRWGDL